jgi:hypothetical protein
MTILCNRCKIPMLQFKIEERFSSESSAVSGSSRPRGHCGVSGAKGLSSAVEPGTIQKGRTYYRCEQCHQIAVFDE